MREPNATVLALAASDPANAYGAILPWPRSDGRMARAAGAYCVLDAGELVLYLERGGRSILSNGEVRAEHVRALMGVAIAAGKVEVQRVDGIGVMESPLAEVLREAGFASTHRGLVVYGART